MKKDPETTTDYLVDVDTTRQLLRPSDTLKDVHVPKCTCPAAPVYDFQLREFANGTLHVYRFCRGCGTRARSPVPRTNAGFLQKLQALLIASGREV